MMRSRWISITSLFLLTLFVFNVCVFGVVLAADLYLHQLAQQEKLHKPSKNILELRISKTLVENSNTEFQWKKDWEFMYRGEMYDIVESELEEDTWIFRVKHDSKEDEIRKQIERKAKDEEKERTSNNKKNLTVVVYFSEEISLTILSVSTDCVIPGVNCPTDEIHQSIPDPPPWLV